MRCPHSPWLPHDSWRSRLRTTCVAVLQGRAWQSTAKDACTPDQQSLVSTDQAMNWSLRNNKPVAYVSVSPSAVMCSW